MKYLRSYQYIFDHKDWLMQVLMIALGMLIPVIGPIVLLGYSFELMEWLIANPDAKEYPKFDFSRFTENLKRGMWPFLTQLIISLVISVPVSLVAFVIMFIAGLLAKDAPILIVLAQIFLFVISMALGIVISVVTTPAMLHAGFKSKLDFSGLTAFVKDFAKRMWKLPSRWFS
jgi:ABC-type glycerol-3-phosphate transport system permease component